MYLKRKEYQCDVCKKYSEDVYSGNEAAKDYDLDFYYNFLDVYRKAKNIKPIAKLNIVDIRQFQICKECLKIKDVEKHLIGPSIKFYEAGKKS